MRVTVTFEIETPMVPNFLRRTDGKMIRLCDIHRKELDTIAELWLSELRRKWDDQSAADSAVTTAVDAIQGEK